MVLDYLTQQIYQAVQYALLSLGLIRCIILRKRPINHAMFRSSQWGLAWCICTVLWGSVAPSWWTAYVFHRSLSSRTTSIWPRCELAGCPLWIFGVGIKIVGEDCGKSSVATCGASWKEDYLSWNVVVFWTIVFIICCPWPLFGRSFSLSAVHGRFLDDRFHYLLSMAALDCDKFLAFLHHGQHTYASVKWQSWHCLA